MLIGGIVAGLVAGLALGGRFENLGDIRLRWLPLLFLAVILRFGTEAGLAIGIGAVDSLRLFLFGGAYALLLLGLWVNRGQPGLSLAFVGILSNAIVIAINGGHMLIWEPSLLVAGFDPSEINSVFHVIIGGGAGAEFLLRAGFLGDIIPIPLPLVANVASIGDVFLTAGLAFFLFSVVLRPTDADRAAQADLDADTQRVDVARLRGLAGAARLPRTLDSALGRAPGRGRAIRPATGLTQNLAESAALDRPLLFGSHGTGLAGPALAPLHGVGAADADRRGSRATPPLAVGQVAVAVPGAIVVPGPSILERTRRHPYVRLALNGSFSALWTGQLISLFGDRMHQIALSFLVLGVTDSILASAMVFVAATLPNLFLAPIAGAYVDRWDKQQVLVVSDLLRAGVVLLIPVVAVMNVLLVYPLAFALTAISIFFRPARVAILPRLVRDDELLPANSALWVGETLADVIGYPLAGLFVLFLGTSLPLAFWFDGVTYIASAVLLGSMIVPPLARRAIRATAEDDPTDQASDAEATDAEALGTPTASTIAADLRTGWKFLRGEAVLLTNTIQGAVGQFGSGILIALTPAYALGLVGAIEARAAYAFLETGLGLGNLVGGFAIGLVGSRLAKGRLIVVGYVICGLCLMVVGLTNNLPLAVGLMAGAGVANMMFLIPSQTLFQERTPEPLIGRVVGFRHALVFGSMTLAMGVGGVLGEAFGPATIIVVGGLTQVAAGLLGALVPAARDA